ncbi:MAG: type II toxin-antitoxin system RelE/ParE family toxin [Nitrospirae bacterium]|nr:type II toxin-antitoxin system RelE/ParE family toxin [Nitrospirota bacterium]MDA1304422.1 type II toxin-antitoxin system RelE/ParE family toxin [Nitrospirota bacterium]
MAAIRWTQRSRDDLQEVYDFISRDSPRSAEIFIDRIISSTERLSAFPQSGRALPEFPDLPYREIIVSSYRVIYRHDVEGDHVLIAAVMHGRRDLQNL